MKTCLFTGCKLDGKDALGSDRYMRNVKYLKYYGSIQDRLGFADIWLSDNASEKPKLDSLQSDFGVQVIRHEDELHKTQQGGFDYPYCWRALYDIRTLIDAGYKKIIMIDSDCFVLSQKLAEFIKKLDSGWTTLWCKRWNFPEASFQVICE